MPPQKENKPLTEDQQALVDSGEIAKPAEPVEGPPDIQIELTEGLDDELTGVVEQWDTDIVRSVEMEQKVLSDAYDQGMAYEDFVKEWTHVHGSQAPTQKDYDNWIQWGTQGLLAAQGGGDQTFDADVDVKNLLVGLGYEEEQLSGLDGITASWFKEEDLEYLLENDIKFDPITDNKYVIVPEGTEMASGRYTEVLNLDGYSMMYKMEDNEWYENEFMTYAMIVASVALAFTGVGAVIAAPIAAGASALGAGATVAGIAGGAVAGATLGGLSAGAIQETLGGDFADGLEDGMIKGGITGGLSGGLSAGTSLSQGKQSLLIGSADVASELLTGADLDDALLSGAAKATGTQVGAELDSDLADALISSSDVLLEGGSLEQYLTSAGSSYVSKFGSKTVAERDSEVSNKVKEAANRSRAVTTTLNTAANVAGDQ